MEDKKWITLNSYGKYCLKAFIYALSSTDIRTTQMDYLWDKGLVEPSLRYSEDERHKRHELAGKCLTDVGLETAKHYIQKL